MSGQYYQQPPPQGQQPNSPQFYPPEKKGLESFFIAKDKLGLFLILCAGMMLIGFLLLNLVSSGLVDSGDAIKVIKFLGMVAVDAGIVILLTLILVAGIYREDLPEKTRNWMILVFGFGFVVFMYVKLYSPLDSLVPFFG